MVNQNLLIGFLLSLLAALSCTFFSFENVTGEPWVGLTPPFDSTISANIGLFKYEITNSLEPMEMIDDGECVPYENILSDLTGQGVEMWVASEFCAVVAVVLSGLAFIVNLVEVICCNYPFSCLLPAIMLFIAFVMQVCTFLVFGRSEFWYVQTCQEGYFAKSYTASLPTTVNISLPLCTLLTSCSCFTLHQF